MRSSTSTRPRARRAFTVVATTSVTAATVALLSGCIPDHEPPARNLADTIVAPTPGAMLVQPGLAETSPEVSVSAIPTTTAELPPPAAPVRPPVPATSASLDALASSLPELTGIALAPVGRGQEVTVLGDLTTGVAWSTSKVPLAIAALRENPGVTAEMRASITQSDNDAAEAMWQSLGGGERAASAVTQVLRLAGDETTVVPSTRLREGFTVFGQTEWSAASQVTFGANLPCLPDSGPVLDEMGMIVPEQRWGLGRIDGARFKGGWGPAASHAGYLARQFGILPTPTGDVAVAILADAENLAAAQVKLDAVAQSLDAQLVNVPGGECPAAALPAPE